MGLSEGSAEWRGVGGAARGCDTATADVAYQVDRDGRVFVRPGVPRAELDATLARLERAGMAWVRSCPPGRGVVADWWDVWAGRMVSGQPCWQRLGAANEEEAWLWRDMLLDQGCVYVLVRGPGQSGPPLR